MNKYYKPMVPTLVERIPDESDWIYEPKYDGFRCLLYITGNKEIHLISRNLHSLTASFPEIISSISSYLPKLSKYIPVILDGEIVILDSEYRANFEKIQQRGRTKAAHKIKAFTQSAPASFIAFDMLQINGKEIMNLPLLTRKEYASDFFYTIDNNQENKKETSSSPVLTWIQFFYSSDKLWSKIVEENGEGIIAKRKSSKWIEGARTTDWLKIKNWKRASFFVLSLEKQNSYFHVGLVKNQSLHHAGLFKYGLREEERAALMQIIKSNAVKEDSRYIYIDPSICVELKFLDWYKDEIRQPRFSKFRLDLTWEDCTWEEARIHSLKSR